MARWPLAFALLCLFSSCTRAGPGTVGAAKPGLFDRLLGRDWEAFCLQPSTPSCGPYSGKLSVVSLAECCRQKCRAGDGLSCQLFLERHPVTTPEFWNLPKVLELGLGERLGIVAPPELVEYLALQTGIDRLESVGDDPDLRRDLRAAWEELPVEERALGTTWVIGVAAIKGLGSPVRAVQVRQHGFKLSGFLAFDWGTTLQPVNEWAKKSVEPSSRNHRRTTLVWLLRIGIARIARRPEPRP